MIKKEKAIGLLLCMLIVTAVVCPVAAESLPQTYTETQTETESSQESTTSPEPEESTTPSEEPTQSEDNSGSQENSEEGNNNSQTQEEENTNQGTGTGNNVTSKPSSSSHSTQGNNTSSSQTTNTYTPVSSAAPSPTATPTPSPTPTPEPSSSEEELSSAVTGGYDGGVSVTVSQIDNRQVNFIGIMAWVCIALGIVVVLLVLLSNRYGPRGGSGRKRYRTSKPGRRKKGRLLSDRYYRDNYRNRYR